MPPYDARAVANTIVAMAAGTGQRVSHLKLQKLLFLCHAFYIVSRGRPLVKREFEAWKRGPVHRDVYEAFRKYSRRPIDQPAERLDPVRRTWSIIAPVEDDDVVAVMRRVLDFYLGWSARQLVDLTHAKEGPWDYVVRNAEVQANLGFRIPDRIVLQRFRHHWGVMRHAEGPDEPDEDQPFA